MGIQAEKNVRGEAVCRGACMSQAAFLVGKRDGWKETKQPGNWQRYHSPSGKKTGREEGRKDG